MVQYLLGCLIALTAPLLATCQGDTTQYPDGNITYPSHFGITYQEGTTINITWTTVYTNMNLFYAQYGDDANSKSITGNLQQNWWSWEVAVTYSNLTAPIHLRVVNAKGSDEDQLGGGFWSPGFFVVRNSASASTSTPTPSATTKPSSMSPITPGGKLSWTSTASKSPTSTLSASTSATSTAQSNAGGKLGAGEKAGIGVGVVGGISAVVGLVLGGFYLGKRLQRKQQNLAEAQPVAYDALALSNRTQYGSYSVYKQDDHKGIYSPDASQTYEAPDSAATVHELSSER